MATGNNLKIKKSQIKGSFIVPDGTFADEEKPLIFKSQISQRVSVSRDGSKDAEPFSSTGITMPITQASTASLMQKAILSIN